MPEPILKMDAYIWNGRQKLYGKLILKIESLQFVLSGFENSRISWKINRKDIIQAKDFLVFDIERLGLQIEGKDGLIDLFVMENKVELNTILKMLNQ